MCPQTQRGRAAGRGDQAGPPQEGGVQCRGKFSQWDAVAGKFVSCHLVMMLMIKSGSEEWTLFILENLDESKSCPDEYVWIHEINKTSVV